jgi:hypothetical protein
LSEQGWLSRPSAPAERLAALRLLIGGYGLVYLATRFPHVVGVASFSPRQFAPVGPVTLLAAPLPYSIVVAIAAAAVLAGFAFVAGLRYRVSGPLFGVLLLWATSYRNSWSMIFHTENLLVLHVLVLGLVPAAADVWSLDARKRDAPEPGPEGFRWGWPILLLCAVTVATYFIAGFTKLDRAGLQWVTSDTLRYHVAYDNIRKIELGSTHSPIGAALAGHAWAFPPLAALSMVVEVLAPLALLHRRVGHLWAVTAWSFHLGVLVVMAIVFHYPLLGFAYAPFFAVERGVGALGRRLAQHPALARFR